MMFSLEARVARSQFAVYCLPPAVCRLPSASCLFALHIPPLVITLNMQHNQNHPDQPAPPFT